MDAAEVARSTTKAQLETRADALAQHLAAHHRVIDQTTLKRLGFSRQFASSQVRARRWQRVYRGVWCAYTGPLSFESRCQAALYRVGPGAALDGATSAQIFGLRGHEDANIHVVVAHSRAVGSTADIVVRRSRTLGSSSTQIRRGLTVVRLERALLAWALGSGAAASSAVVDAVQQGLTTAERLRGCFLGLRIGSSWLVSLLDDIEGGSRSELERRFLQIVREAGLATPSRQHPLQLHGRRMWLDLAYPALRIAIEIDGRAYHLMSEDWADDLDRQNLIALDGWLILRFTARAIRSQPDVVAASVARAIEARAAA
ncbi:MAG: endonuclease domain-containing protein [Frankia sp.]|nr:endonuclease domain-containing protein [Frankia sp.]